MGMHGYIDSGRGRNFDVCPEPWPAALPFLLAEVWPCVAFPLPCPERSRSKRRCHFSFLLRLLGHSSPRPSYLPTLDRTRLHRFATPGCCTSILAQHHSVCSCRFHFFKRNRVPRLWCKPEDLAVTPFLGALPSRSCVWFWFLKRVEVLECVRDVGWGLT